MYPSPQFPSYKNYGRQFGLSLTQLYLKVFNERYARALSIDSISSLVARAFSFAFAFDDHNFVQVGEVSFNLFLRFSFLSSSAEALAFGHRFHISSFLSFSHIKYTFKLLRSWVSSEIPFLAWLVG